MRVADYIATHLKSIGVETIFTMSGGLQMHNLDAAAKAGLRIICHSHEQSCGFAADAYARQSGKLGVAFVTGGPGVSNILTPVVGCWQDSIPLLVIAGQVKTASLMRPGERQRGTFEINPLPIFASVTKYCCWMNVMYARTILTAGIEHALSNRPGPVFLEVPLDVQGAEYAE